MGRVLLFALVATTLLAQDRPPTTEEITKAYESKVSEQVHRILFWEKRFAIFTVRDVRGWDIRFKHLTHESVGPVVKQRYQAVAKKASGCHEYGVTHVTPIGPLPHHVKRHIQVDDLGQVACK